MAAACVARPAFQGTESLSCRPRIQKSKTQLVEKNLRDCPSQKWTAGSSYTAGGMRYPMHTANPMNHPSLTTARPTPASRNTLFDPDLLLKASALVAELLQCIALPPLHYGLPAPSDDHEQTLPLIHETDSLAYAVISTDTLAPVKLHHRSQSQQRSSSGSMATKIDFGDTSGFQTRGKKKKKAQSFDPWADDEEKKEDGNGGGDDSGGGNGGDTGGGAGGSGGGGGDDNNGAGDDDDDWGFGTSKKNKKNKKKKQEEEEEERKKQEEEAAAATADPLSWADEANDAAADDDWTLGFSSAKKDKKKKKKGVDDEPPPAVPDAPPAAGGFHDISLDDGSPKLDFSFSGLGDGKKDTGGSFGAWGKTWDFDSIGKGDKKDDKDKSETTALGDNNPWSVGSKTKKKSALASFDFGDFGASTNNDLSFGGDDLADSKGADDAWGFTSTSKKDKKKKGVIEEIKEEEPEPVKEEDASWGGWGMKSTKKKTTKNALDDALSSKKTEPIVEEPDTTFDWGFGKKDKKKDLLSTVDEKSKETSANADAADGDDWMAAAWGKTSSKKKSTTTKKTSAFDDISASLDLTSPADTKSPSKDAEASDPWAAFTDAKKDKKKTKKGLIEEEPLPPPPPPAPEPAAEDDIWATFGAAKKSKKSKADELEPQPEITVVAEETNEPLVAWDFGLTPAKKRKKEREMRMEGTWDSRVTQDMVDEAAEAEPKAAEEPEPALEVAEPKVAWDASLNDKEKKRKMKEMKLDGTWESRITQEMIDEEEAAAATAAPEPEPEPLEPKVAWDAGLTDKDKRKKMKEMKLDGTWESRLTQEMIDEEAAAAAAAEPEPEPEAEPAEPKVAWDAGLTDKDKRKKMKEMKLDGTWESRITQEMIDEEAAAVVVEPEPIPDPEPVEPKVAWDNGLTDKDKRKKMKEMKLDGTWESRITQEMVDEETAATAAAAVKEPEPEPELVKEPKVAWDFGLTPLKKKRMEKEMKLDGTWDSRITQEMVDAEQAEVTAAAVAEAETIKEERKPWDHGLTAVQKRKTEREMKANGTWESRLTQEMIDAEAEAATAPEPLSPAKDDPWGAFSTWGTSSNDKKKKGAVTFDSKADDKADDGWGSGWGLSSKDKKKKSEPDPEPVSAKKEKADDIWDIGLSSKDKKKKEKEKDGKKKSPIDEIVPEEPAAPDPPAEDDIWGSWGKADKKSKKGKKMDELPPPAPTPPAQGLTPEPKPTDMPDVDDFGWAGLDSGKKTKKAVEEPPKKSSIWGFGSSTSAKTKKEKEAKAKKEAEEEAKREEEERIQREADEAEAARLAEEEAAKKKSKNGKLSKTSSKTEDKKKNDDLLDLLDDPLPTTSSSKLKKTSTKTSDKVEDDKMGDSKGTTDYFGFWGTASTSKKTAGKKDVDNKKEIGKQGLTNGGDTLADLAKDLESPIDDKFTTSSSKLTKTMSNGKTKVGSSVADRIKALEGGKKESIGKKSKVDEEPLTKGEPALVATLSPKEEKNAIKSKTTTKSKKESPSSLTATEEKKSKDSVPGSFPGAFGDEEDLLADDFGKNASDKKTKKSSKVEPKATTKSTKTTKAETTSKVKSMDFASNDIDLLDDSKLPTPPPEDKKSGKKERPRVERASTTSWGFWGSTPPPKKGTKAKTEEDDSSTENKKEKSPPALMRSKSTRTPKEKEAEDRKEAERNSKSSGSEKESSSKTKERAKASRGLSFSNFMLGGAPPSAMRTSQPTRRSSVAGSKSSSRRQSMDRSGLASPPPDKDNEITDKAAKIMGMKSSKPTRKSSVKDKSKAYVDPYPIDDDDMVMINTADKSNADAKKSKEKAKVKTSTKTAAARATKPRSKTLSGDEDVVMVDTPGDGAVTSGGDDLESPDRGGTIKKATGFFGSFFTATKVVSVEKPVSTPASDFDDGGLPIRTKSTRRRSKVPEGDTTDAPMETDADIEARRADRRAKRDAREKAEEEERAGREQKRKERRDREKADLEARREKARDRARQEREAEDQRREEKRARKREKDERLAREEAEAEAAAEKRREERRRLREKLETEGEAKGPSREERRRSYAFEEDDRRARKDDRKSRLKDPKRRSTPLMDEYHESRSGSGRGVKPPENKTSSWIDSQKDEPPDIPPVEGTVLDESGQKPRPVDEIDPASRRRRKDKSAQMTEDEYAEYKARKRAQRRAVEKSASGGSDDKDGRKSSRRSKIIEDDLYADNVKTFDGRPGLGRSDSKRNSFLGKFF